MKLENQVTSLELSKKLKELGVRQESLFYWTQIQSPEWSIRQHSELDEVVEGGDGWTYLEEGLYRECVYSAFTVAELGEMLPKALIQYETFTTGHRAIWNHGEHTELENTEADARAKMLIYLLEKKLITL